MVPLLWLGLVPRAIVATVLVARQRRRRARRRLPPLPPHPFNPRWRTADVVGLARGIASDRAYHRLPLLADALMDAGCDDERILACCRGERRLPGKCWVVDAILRVGRA